MRAALLCVVLAGCLQGEPAAPDAAPPTDAVPVACDGHLCKTDNGGTCNATGAEPGLAIAALLLLRRRRK